jgi:hypothetical protein
MFGKTTSTPGRENEDAERSLSAGQLRLLQCGEW